MSQTQEKLKRDWAVALYHSGFGSPQWRDWKMLHNNQEMDPVLKRQSLKNIGLQGGHLVRGFEDAHIDIVFNRAYHDQKRQECILRFKINETPEVYLLFYFVPLDKRHMVLVYTPIDKKYVPEGFNKESWHPGKGPEHYGLSKKYTAQLEEEIKITKRMLPDW